MTSHQPAPTVSVGDLKLANHLPLVLIAGPCVIESASLCLEVAHAVKEICQHLSVGYIFKSSFDKANRSSIHSYRGLGLKEGLSVLARVREEVGVPVTTDFHLPEQAAPVAEVVDLIQVPAFLCRQTDMLVAAAGTGKPVNVKKGQFLSPWEMVNVVEKLRESGAKGILLTERGSSFGYQNLVVDMRSLAVMKGLGCPVVMDATHAVQRPGGLGRASGGDREFVLPLSLSAVAQGIAALFWEVHPDPDRALSDGPNMLPLGEVEEALSRVVSIDRVVKGASTEDG